MAAVALDLEVLAGEVGGDEALDVARGGVGHRPMLARPGLRARRHRRSKAPRSARSAWLGGEGHERQADARPGRVGVAAGQRGLDGGDQRMRRDDRAQVGRLAHGGCALRACPAPAQADCAERRRQVRRSPRCSRRSRRRSRRRARASELGKTSKSRQRRGDRARVGEVAGAVLEADERRAGRSRSRRRLRPATAPWCSAGCDTGRSRGRMVDPRASASTYATRPSSLTSG